MSSLKRIVSIVLSVLLWIFILLAALFTFVTLATRDENHLASVAGFSPLTIESNSMAPTFNQGDLIFIKQTDTDKLEVGDIVTFHTIIENQYALNTHRIVDITEENGIRQYVTQGDNNALADTHIITDGDILGVYVSHIPHMGTVMNFLSGKVGFFVVIVIPLLLLFIYQVYHLISVAVELKKAAALEAAEQAAEYVRAKKKKQESEEEPEDYETLKREAEEYRRLKREAEERAKAESEEHNA